ncbi:MULTISPECIES: serine/threonine-protein kinase [unclassified Tolypothrix]|uniref:serine/threonine-protein kinase n=1 Tax=unclassified Tolypothrix TaxID=2649714 RepID=UPI000906E2C6|nr:MULTISPECIES: serine/threonine-protein kinase [unclassified Tolypothrix]MBE9085218.1 serine/threonine protein kinase [Tolypothrix sp. LEGE 11397]UYD27303.1 serine/threonine protein kinase [Tolypothrix sp. PCC 7712]UYD36837.1 serine/threonine protein kinase [Tolypothrix sp. PCC 7601]BAY93460.1 serine/threonine protein kinase [Microchaete diplosiphon NIES-3275]
MSHITQSTVHCINPDCQRPYPQPWGNKFCNSCGAPLQLLDRYVPIQPLGSGGFAQIYTVWDVKTQTERVLKVLVENSAKALDLFRQEASVLINLRHPGVPRVDADGYFLINLTSPQQHQLPCLVMEKINGQTLEDIRKNYPQGCPEEMVLNWFTQAVEILQELHKRQIIHRDIKPSNLMLRNSLSNSPVKNQLVLIDFGGAKQFRDSQPRYQSSSTRLFSSGYSPPEQVSGGNVGPSADFYALGRTMIELLTGKYPPELEDVQTGTLQWRNRVNINPKFADLLDEMVQEDVRSRPTSANIIKKRLTQLSSVSLQEQLSSLLQNTNQQVSTKLTLFTQSLERVVGKFTKAVSKTTLLIIKAIAQFLLACIITIWSMILTGMGAAVGAIAGFFLAYRTVLGDRVAQFIFLQVPGLFPDNQTVLASEVLIFAAAGLGTAWGLTLAGGFAQRRRFLVVSLMGTISYGLGWLALQLTIPKNSNEGLVVSIVFAIFLLTLSLGLRSHRIVYAVITSLGTALIFAALIRLELLPTIFQFSTPPRWPELLPPMIYFAVEGIFLSFWLGVSYYLIVPGLRLLGWR